MIGNILHTFGSRIAIAGISFGVLLLNAQNLGAAGLGTAGLIILNVTIVVLLCNLIHGGIIYFYHRLNRGNLMLISYLWTAVSLLLYALLHQLYPLIDAEYFLVVLGLGALQALGGLHFYLLLGKEKIKQYNFISLLQSLILIGGLSLFYLLWEEKTIDSFINCMLAAYGFSYGLAFVLSTNAWQKPELKSISSTFTTTLQYGTHTQAANLFQLLNYRISYFFLDALSGRAALGHFTASVQISEALLLPGRSIATVQYARISKRKQENYAKRISLFFMKISWMITLLGVFVLLLIPSTWFEIILGEEFSNVKLLILYMAVGIVTLSAEIVISHYFSGTGKVKINSASAAIGFMVTLVGCLLLIEPYGAAGAAISTSLSYSAMFLFLFVKMNQKSGLKFNQFFPNQRDFILLSKLWKKFRA